MRLLDLEPQLLATSSDPYLFHHVDELSRAQGVRFTCPCGRHAVVCWFPGVEQSNKHWTPSGTGLADLSLSPSIVFPGGCREHFWVRGGEVVPA